MTLRTDLFSDVAQLLHDRYDIDPAQISEETRLEEELGLDSLDLIATAMALQNRYCVSLDDEGIASVRTISDVIDFAEEKIRTKDPAAKPSGE